MAAQSQAGEPAGGAGSGAEHGGAGAGAGAHRMPPPFSEDVINLAFLQTALAAVVLPLVMYIMYRHGKPGVACWSIFFPVPIMMIVGQVYLIVNREKPGIPSAVGSLSDAAIIICMSKTIIGMVFETISILPAPKNKWYGIGILAVLNITNTAGIGLASYGGSPSATGAGGVINQLMSRIGCLMMLWVLVMLGAWIVPTWHKTQRVQGVHPNAHVARILMTGAMVTLPIWIGRVIYMLYYSFNHQQRELDPVMGSLAVKMMLFGFVWGATAAIVGAGAYSMLKIPEGGLAQNREGGTYVVADNELSRQATGPDVEMYGHASRPKY